MSAPKTRQCKPRVLITGAAGALAKQVIERIRKTCDLVAVDARIQVPLGDDIPSYCLDFNHRNFEDLFRRYQFDGVIHLGRIRSSQLTRMRRYNANVLGTQKLLDLSHKYNIRRIVVLSTFHVYGAMAYNPALINESAPMKSAGLSADLIDSVELENLANIYLWRFPELNIAILRPCNIVGPSVSNTMSTLLSSQRAPVLAGFSPMMQFIHIDDMADAIVLAYQKPVRGIFNVASDDWVAYQRALELCGCTRIPVPSVPPVLPRFLMRALRMRSFPAYLMDFFKYPVIIDGRAFAEEFGFSPKRPLKEIFRFYRDNKTPL
ncbi:SDR family oxidoreductase [Marinobacter sp. 2_MG-2023]|uniref:SDR family oxidoreductase n=1 Tax=Marinobacter sp. 2_MG-2023 TaxID=3062679 RepID=UPI0026E200DA|nr:SDR family oxidoreductase [Marinobacter sp. 2_MG-2023]MDO6442504.1 SDR family oxidoreductase [Marinobacter sp. 2_MG-2023]